MTRSLFGDWEKTQSGGISELEFWTWKAWLWVRGQEGPRMNSMSLDLGSWVGWAHEGTQEQSCQACWLSHTDTQEIIKPVATVSGSSPVPALGIKDAWVYPKQCKETKCICSNVRWKKKRERWKIVLTWWFPLPNYMPRHNSTRLLLKVISDAWDYGIFYFLICIFNIFQNL